MLDIKELNSNFNLNRPNMSEYNTDNNYFIIIHYCTTIGLCAHMFFLFLFTFMGIKTLAFFNIASVSIWAACLYVSRKGYHRTAQSIATIEIVLHAILATVVLGWYSGFHYYIICIISFSFFTPFWKNISQLLANVVLFLGYLALDFYSQSNSPIVNCSHSLIHWLAFMNVLSTVLILGAYSFIFKQSAEGYSKKLAKANNILNIMAITDPLTCVLNRRGLMQRLDIDRQLNFLITLCDIDDFKKFNDLHGHDCGDYVLKGVADIIVDSIDNYGSICRWGGEEFLILLTECSIDKGKALVEKTRKNIERSCFSYNGRDLSVTATFGQTVACSSENFLDSVRRADSAMRRGKEGSKNCVIEEAFN